MADVLFYVEKDRICFPMKLVEGFSTIDLDPLIESAKQAMSKAAFDQDMLPVLYYAWRTSYPCKK